MVYSLVVNMYKPDKTDLNVLLLCFLICEMWIMQRHVWDTLGNVIFSLRQL